MSEVKSISFKLSRSVHESSKEDANTEFRQGIPPFESIKDLDKKENILQTINEINDVREKENVTPLQPFVIQEDCSDYKHKDILGWNETEQGKLEIRHFWKALEQWDSKLKENDKDFSIREMLEDMWLLDPLQSNQSFEFLQLNLDLWHYILWRIDYVQRKSRKIFLILKLVRGIFFNAAHERRELNYPDML